MNTLVAFAYFPWCKLARLAREHEQLVICWPRRIHSV